MAEAAVVLVIARIASVLGEEAQKQGFTHLLREGSQLREAHGKLQKVQGELEVIRGFLHDINWREGGSSDSGALGAWVAKIRKEAHAAEDVIDKASYLLARPRGGGLGGFLHRALHVKPWIHVVHELQRIESSLDDLSKMKERYSIAVPQSSIGGPIDLERISKLVADQSRLMQEDEVVGIGQSKATLMNWLVGADEPDQRLITSVWGMGGLGKTTLINQVYKSSEVKEHFRDCRAWISVSQTYQVDDLMRTIFKELTSKEHKNMAYVTLAEELQNFLKNKRYLVVLDDVWHADVWYKISGALIDNEYRSRVVITTRRDDVACLATDKYHMKLEPLGKEDAWALFCKKAFRDRSCPPELKKCAGEMVDKCGGLPLAIVSLGSMLSLRYQSEWESVYKGLSWEFDHNPELDQVKSILMLSFKEVPYYLRNCLLYCSVFPEDYLIKRKKLIRLWVAEGFVEERSGKTMEEVAGDFLNELVHRSMLEVVERNDFGRIKGCRMHDLVRELLVSISQREKFSRIYEVKTASDEIVVQSDARRLSMDARSVSNIQDEEEIDEEEIQSNNNWLRKQMIRCSKFHSLLAHAPTYKEPMMIGCSQLRSLLLYVSPYHYPKPAFYPKPTMRSLLTLAGSCRLLRVLDLQGIHLTSVRLEGSVLRLQGIRLTSVQLEGIFALFNLRYLSLRDTGVTEIPNGIRRLIHLETLDLRHTGVNFLKKLPSGVAELKRLRHLYLHYRGAKIPSLFAWTELQTLSGVIADEEMLRHLNNVTQQLVCLRITEVKQAHSRYLCAALSKMSKLITLAVSSGPFGEEDIELDTLSLPSPSLLQKVFLNCPLKGGCLPTWVGSLDNLTQLVLGACWLREDQDPLSSLHALPCLISLALSNLAFVGPRLCFREGWLRKLRILRLYYLFELRVVEMEQGTMPSLGFLAFYELAEMKEIPVGIEHLTSLQEWELHKMPEEFMERLQNEEVQHKLRHIPVIRNW